MNEKVLIVDNSEAFLLPISRFLSSQGYEVRTALDGLEALDLMEEFRPEIMFIDLVMPKLRGEKLCQIIKSKDQFKDIFLVILSGIAAEEIASYTDYGADACIAKGPFPKMREHLLLTIKERNSLKKGSILGIEHVYKREITQELLVSGKHNNIVLKNISDGIMEIALDGKILAINPKGLRIFDKKESDILATDFFSMVREEDVPQLRNLFANAKEDPLKEPEDYVIPIRDRQIIINVIYVEDQEITIFILVLRDITAFKEVEKNLTQALDEREVLLRETFHRIKNNLTMITSLIHLESQRLKDEDDQSIFRDIISRVESISLIHEKLHHSMDMTYIELGDYLKELTDNIFAVTANPEDTIFMNLELAPLKVTFNEAVPLALIVSELLTNSIKYGFPPAWNRSGEKKVTLSVSRGDKDCTLVFSDNGVGFPADFSISSQNTLGLTLVEALTRQLEGTLEMSGEQGASFTVNFPLTAR